MLINGNVPLNVMAHTSHHSLSDITWDIGVGLNKYQSKISVGSELQKNAISAIRT
jgi:hypothetical protein